MKNIHLSRIIILYLVIGSIWLVVGAQLITWVDKQYPLIDLRNLYHIKNLIFLIGTAVAALFALKYYYHNLLITERRYKNQLSLNEQQLNQQIKLYETVTKATNDVIWDYDIVNDKIKWMSGYKELFGYEEEQTIYDAFWSMSKIHPEDQERVTNAFQDLLDQKKQKWKEEYRYMCSDGIYKYVSDRGYLIFNGNNIPVRMLGAMQDIDVKKRYEEQLVAQNKQLKEIAWLNSHEIRRPLSNILGLIPLIKSSCDDNESLAQFIELLETSANELDEAVIKINKSIK